MLRWSTSIWKKYIDFFNNEPIPSLLIMDQATMHTNDIAKILKFNLYQKE